MIAFAACATLMIATSLLWLLRPLRAGTGPRPSAPRTSATVIALVVPCITVALYARLGNVDALVPPPVDATRAAAEQMVARLAARLRDAPDDVRGWRTLARSYVQLHRDADAVEACRRLVALQPDDADALVDLAEALATTRGGSLVGEPLRQVDLALALDPDHARALALAAQEAAERNDLATAINYWERLSARSSPGSPVALAVDANLERARTELAKRIEPDPTSR